MTDVVTRLVVRADGSFATLDQFEKGMSDAGKATDYASGAVASFEKRMEVARQAIERGNAITTQTVARKSQEERAWEKWSATIDRTTGLRIRQEREAASAAAAAANVVNMGRETEERALMSLMALERRHVAQMSAHIAAENNVALAYTRRAAAADQATLSTSRLTAANSSQNSGANTFNTANVAAQFQDIGVTAAMGMSPIQIALQQGTQLSAVLGGQGLTGVVRTLGAAFASVLSPVSLLTIGVVALVAWGIQAFAGIGKEADNATTALERHNELLDKTLEGYEAARAAAAGVLDQQRKAPAASVVSDLTVFRADALQRYEEILGRVRDEQAAWNAEIDLMSQASGPEEIISQMQRVMEIVDEVGISADTSLGQLNGLHASLTLIKNSGADDAVVATAEALLLMIDQARIGKATVDSLGGAINSLDRDVQIRISVSQEFTAAVGSMQDLYIDPRSRFDVAREDLRNQADQAMATAQTYGQITGAAKEYERVLASINAAEAEANKKAGTQGAKAAQKPFDQWGGSVEQFQQRIASQRMEMELLGQSTFEVERQKAAFDLLNQAKQAGIPITSQVTDQINLMSSEYATATVEMQRQQAAQAQLTETYSFGKNAFSSFMSDFRRDLTNGASLWESFGSAAGKALDSIADRALSMAANGLFDMLFGAVLGGVTGGNFMGGSLGAPALQLGFQKGIPGFADGTNSAPGGLSWVGERGPELLNLPRGSQVIPNGPSMAMAANQNSGGDIYINNVINVPPGAGPETAPAIAREVTKELRRQLPDAIQTYNRNPLRRTG